MVLTVSWFPVRRVGAFVIVTTVWPVCTSDVCFNRSPDHIRAECLLDPLCHLLGSEERPHIVTALAVPAGSIIAGASTFLETTLSYASGRSRFNRAKYVASRDWWIVFTVGIVVGGIVHAVAFQDGIWVTRVQPWRLAVGGVLVGIGTVSGRGVRPDTVSVVSAPSRTPRWLTSSRSWASPSARPCLSKQREYPRERGSPSTGRASGLRGWSRVRSRTRRESGEQVWSFSH